jgi:hypothetical protein
MPKIVHTDNGKPVFAMPEKPDATADIETKIAYMRAKHAYNDAVAAAANRTSPKSKSRQST